MTDDYGDRWITCDAGGITVRAYYFPWGTKRISWSRIRSVRRIPMTTLFGRGRIWGSTNLRTWASLDPQRPRKSEALVLDIGGVIRPIITPDDVDAVGKLIATYTDVTVERAPRLPL